MKARLLLVSILATGVAGCGGTVAPPAPPEGAAPPSPTALRSDLREDGRLRAAFLVVDGVYNSELMAPYDVLHHTPFHTGPGAGIEVFTVSPDGCAVTTFEGLRLTPDHGFDDHPAVDILVVPSAEGSMDRDLANDEMIEWVRRVGREARYVISLCDGAFVLAKAGLLDGHSATTFPSDQDRLAEMFPDVDLRRGPGFVHDGKMLTSQGGAKSYDVAMYLVDHLYGQEVAEGVGRGLIIPWPPERPQGVAVTAGE